MENPLRSLEMVDPAADTDGVHYAAADWPEEGFGSQRAVVLVDEPAAAVRVILPWRRRDAEPHKKDIRVTDSTGRRVGNVIRRVVNRERGELVFEPTAGPGIYHIYFLPCSAPKLFQDNMYAPPEDFSDPSWRAACGSIESLPEAHLLRFEARSAFDRRDPMELIATRGEVDALLADHLDALYMVFPEDRRYPARMTADLPYRWVRKGPADHLEGQACPGEYYAFQLGIYACRMPVGGMIFTSGDLSGPAGAVIGAGAIRCLNLGGIDWEGRAFQKLFSVGLGQVRCLWVLIVVPEDALPGQYAGEIMLQPEIQPEGADDLAAGNAPPARLRLILTVAGAPIADHGCRDAWRQSRLGWLDSTLGREDEVIAPYLPLKMAGDSIALLDRAFRFGSNGLPESLVSNGCELLAAPAAFRVDARQFTPVSQAVVLTSASRICREWISDGDGMNMRVEAQVDFDGCCEYRVTLQAVQRLHTEEICLELALASHLTEYFMGLGLRGGFAPQRVDWKWDVDRITNMLWTGCAKAGLHLNLMHSQDIWPQAYTYRPWGTPVSWDHAGRGACHYWQETGITHIRAVNGPRDWLPGETEEYRFRILVTPFKPIDPAQWNYRYGSKTALHLPDPDDGPAQGLTIGHLHHGMPGVNPWINYPFLTLDQIAAYRQRLSELGYQDVDVYYTLREISSHMSELWALRSLGGEIFVGKDSTSGASQEVNLYQEGGGAAWLQEHLIDGYARAWSHIYENGEVDAAIATQGLSRLHNFYVEGMDLLMKMTGCGGLYLDGLAYGRSILQRVARVMSRNRPDYRIKFHSGNNYDFSDWHCNVLLQYAEHLPYITDLWIGEMFDYALPPEYWLVEMSGIPFGLTSEMLNYENGGNPWRGMLYGMDGRMHPSAPGLWKAWDDFGIQAADLCGYWEASCPVKTGRDDILASVYTRPGNALVVPGNALVVPGKVLIALASWCQQDASVQLVIDWAKLGIDPDKAVLTAAEIHAFQPERRFQPGDSIPVAAGQGWLLQMQ